MRSEHGKLQEAVPRGPGCLRQRHDLLTVTRQTILKYHTVRHSPVPVMYFFLHTPPVEDGVSAPRLAA